MCNVGPILAMPPSAIFEQQHEYDIMRQYWYNIEPMSYIHVTETTYFQYWENIVNMSFDQYHCGNVDPILRRTLGQH